MLPSAKVSPSGPSASGTSASFTCCICDSSGALLLLEAGVVADAIRDDVVVAVPAATALDVGAGVDAVVSSGCTDAAEARAFPLLRVVTGISVACILFSLSDEVGGEEEDCG